MTVTQYRGPVRNKWELSVPTTTTSLFILPLTGLNEKYFGEFFISSFVKDTHMEENPPEVFVLVRCFIKMRFKEMEEQIEDNPLFNFSYDLEDGKYTMYNFTVPEDKRVDYERILRGKYSLVSLENQKLILHGANRDDWRIDIFKKRGKPKKWWESKIGQPLSKSAEVWPMFNFEIETFDKHNYFKFYGKNT